MQSGGWPYSEVDKDSSKTPSLCVAVLRAAVFRSLRSIHDCHVLSVHRRVRARAHTEVPEVLWLKKNNNKKAQGKV